jgi:Xaa-Pro aminopeptidase
MARNDPSTDPKKQPNRSAPFSEAFKAYIPQGWEPYPPAPAALPATGWTAARRQAIQDQFPGERLVLPAGQLKVRSNDCDYRYRPHSAFAHLTGLGQDSEPEAALVLGPEPGQAVIYFHPRVARTDPEFYASSRYGEMWVGTRPSLEEMSALTGLEARSIEQLKADLAAGEQPIRVVRDADPAITALADVLRGEADAEADKALEVALSELRLVKDAFELGQMELAVACTKAGFEAVIRQLPEAVRRGRGERWVEGVFGLYARHLGNAVGYDTIAAAGDHANTLHWIRNTGDLKEGDVLLLDAGVEVDTLYTADITRTLPVTGRFTDAQREVYLAVLEAQQAGIDAAKPGAKQGDIHQAAIAVVARKLAEWGCLPVSAEEALSPEGGQFRRWMVHGTSHHLGLDVHDCAQARVENYREGELKPGMVVTVEPGLYFRATDQLAPERFRGIGVRIEDDIVITDDGCRLLSEAFPRHPDDIEAWIAQCQS